jgi:ferric-dicitrate binding protein FerR (iron transport regulator)
MTRAFSQQMARLPRPWLRSVEESIPRHRRPDRRPTVAEAVITAAVLAAVLAVVIWLVFFSTGGLGPGSV